MYIHAQVQVRSDFLVSSKMDVEMLCDAIEARASAPALPPELIFMVLDYLQDIDARSTLLACSFVSRLWRDCASCYLFKRLVLPRHSQPMNLRMVAWLFESAPTISQSVQHLIITSMHPAQHITQDVLVAVLIKLPYLKSLEMKGVDSRSVLSSRAETFKSSLKLEKLKIHVNHALPLNDIMNTLEIFAELDELCLEQHPVAGRPDPVYATALLAQFHRFPRHIKLQSLKLRSTPTDCTMLSLLELEGRFDGLKTLEVVPKDDEDIHLICCWLSSPLARNLRNLKLDVSVISRFREHRRELLNWDALDLSHCPHLNSLTLIIDLTLEERAYLMRYDSIKANFLSAEQVLSKSPITVQHITFRCCSPGESNASWPVWDQNLSNIDWALRRFEDVRLVRWKCERDIGAVVKAVVARDLPTFAAITEIVVS